MTNNTNPNFAKHGFETPFRASILATSGETPDLLTNLICRFCLGQGTFSSITIVTKHKEAYMVLREYCRGITFLESYEDYRILEESDNKQAHLLVFDTVERADRDQAELAFVRGRPRGVSVIIVGYSYSDFPTVVRASSEYFIVGTTGRTSARRLMQQTAGGTNIDAMMRLYAHCTDTLGIPLIIDVDKPLETRFRKGYTDIVDPADFL